MRIPAAAVILTAGLSALLPAFAIAQAADSQARPCVVSAPFDGGKGGTWSGWGNGKGNTRRAQGATLSADDLSHLSVAWAFGFPGARSVIGQPTVAGNRVFIGVDTGDVYAIDAANGCQDWRMKADAGVRTAPVVGQVGGAGLVFVGDLRGQVYALDARSGALRWKVRVDDHAAARLTGTPQFLAAGQPRAGSLARLFVPVSSGEEGAGARAGYPCCTFRGSVVALDAATGTQIWKTYTIAHAAVAAGPDHFAPSGAAIWSAPTVDLSRGLL
ncbi:MAG TPA: PQQ-binding-like beta-propeller repeat protein, partial [Vicinamibacterales bacterium]|nr:PQQ-binding-like beta-propeller repeat protein [Vicinamibacterales bacterium]